MSRTSAILRYPFRRSSVCIYPAIILWMCFLNSFRDFGAHIKEMAAFFTTSEKVVVSECYHVCQIAV